MREKSTFLEIQNEPTSLSLREKQKAVGTHQLVPFL